MILRFRSALDREAELSVSGVGRDRILVCVGKVGYPASLYAGCRERFSRHRGLFVRCLNVSCREEAARDFLPRCHIGSNEPHQVIPRQVASLQSLLPFHLVLSFRLRSGNISTLWPPTRTNGIGRCLGGGVLAEKPGDSQLRGAFGTLRMSHDFCTKLVAAQ